MKLMAQVSAAVAIGVYVGMVAASMTLAWIDAVMWGAL